MNKEKGQAPSGALGGDERFSATLRKRLLIHVCGFNLGLLMRRLTGISTLQSPQCRILARLFSLFGATMGGWLGWNRLWKRVWEPIVPIRCLWLLGPINKPSPR